MMPLKLILMLGGIGGAVSTFLLQKYGISAVVASCIVGLVGALLGHLFKLPELPFIVFAGSFIGMTNTSVGSVPLMIFAGAVSGLLFGYSQKLFIGIGGRLGTLAFISTLICFYALPAIKKVLVLISKN